MPCHPPRPKRGFIKVKATRLLRTNSSKTTFEECLTNFKRRLEAHGYPKKYIESSLSEVTFDFRQSALKPKKHNTPERPLPFVTTYHPVVKRLQQMVMENWSFIENQPLLKTIFKTPPIISYKRDKSLKGLLVRAKPYNLKALIMRHIHNITTLGVCVGLSLLFLLTLPST